MRNTYLAVAGFLTMMIVVWAIVAGNVDSIPDWTIAIPAVISGFWWAFGQSVVGGGDRRPDREAPRAPQTYSGEDH